MGLEERLNEGFAKMPDGLIPAIIQDAQTGQVLMLGYMNAEAFRVTRESGQVTFWSRRRHELWRKGATSSNILAVIGEIKLDCDADAILIQVGRGGDGNVCHNGTVSCFQCSS